MQIPSPPPSSSNKDKGISTVESICNPSHPTVVETPPLNPNQTSKSINNGRKVLKKQKRRVPKSSSPAASSSSSSPSISQQRGGFRVLGKSKNVKLQSRGSEFDGLALPLGMSIAAFVSQVLDRHYKADGRISTDHLSLICTSAVKESLANVFGDRFDCFVKNFGESFGCTLKTLRLVNETSLNRGEARGYSSIIGINKSEASLNGGEPFGHSSIESNNSEPSQQSYFGEHGHDEISFVLKPSICQNASLGGHRNDPSCSGLKSTVAFPTISGICESLDVELEEMRENMKFDVMNKELSLHGDINQELASFAPKKLVSGENGYMLNTFEKSVMEQARSNELKTFEMCLKMKELKLRESQLTLSSDSNVLDRFKLSMGISKASFKAEKYKNQLEETRYAELIKKCIDCLVVSLFIMSASLVYGAYVYSYQRISELTTSCTSPPTDSKSWRGWIPNPTSSFSSGWQTLKCHTVVASRMLFGVFMILAIAYLLLQRSSTSKQTMPVTHILFLLGIMCGIAGTLCVDTLGGNGYLWLLYWETICLLHFLVNTCTSAVFMILHGSVFVTQGVETMRTRLPYWVRRFVFYALVLVFLPLLCGLMPFASFSDWKDHFVSLATDTFSGYFHVEQS